MSYMPKITFGNSPVSSINSEHTNKYTHTYISTGKPPKAAPIGRMILCRFSEVAATRR